VQWREPERAIPTALEKDAAMEPCWVLDWARYSVTAMEHQSSKKWDSLLDALKVPAKVPTKGLLLETE